MGSSARGDIGVLSFARGKPLSALGGGALAWRRRPDAVAVPEDPTPRRASALLRAAAYDLALLPWSFRLLAAVPALHIGETVYDPAFPRGAIDGASLCLASARLGSLERCRLQRSARAESLAAQLRERTRFEPLTAEPGRGAYPRLGVVAPSGAARDAALGSLAHLGATRLYPAPLDGIPALESQGSGAPDLPGARTFAERLLTLPVHAGLRARTVDALTRALERAE
jgi:dTDP-4-amino-4,6-dideoxygalactose transaminase